MTETEVIDRYGVWGSHPDYPPAAWQYEVSNGDTRHGYWAWVVAEIDIAAT
ncbi:MAG: hypothetical protein GX542_03360 [Rhodococcus sp.]|nr:hypothetical protein [Rhodococcus sp. (in: high G+C Gram-positive bacteria)]